MLMWPLIFSYFQNRLGLVYTCTEQPAQTGESCSEMAVPVSVQALALSKPTEILAVAQHIILGVRNLFSHKEGG